MNARDPSRYNCRPEISNRGRELHNWAEPPKWGGVSLRKDFHHWLWHQPNVIDLHFKITLCKKKKILVNQLDFETLFNDLNGNHP